MRKSTIKVTFHSALEDIWNIVTNNQDVSWRSDLTSLETIDEKTFIEHGKNDFQVKFAITKMEPYETYEFDMECVNFKGHWIGKFRKIDDSKTELEFTEILYMKNKMMEVLSHVFMNLKGMQKQYMRDLEKALKKAGYWKE